MTIRLLHYLKQGLEIGGPDANRVVHPALLAAIQTARIPLMPWLVKPDILGEDSQNPPWTVHYQRMCNRISKWVETDQQPQMWRGVNLLALEMEPAVQVRAYYPGRQNIHSDACIAARAAIARAVDESDDEHPEWAGEGLARHVRLGVCSMLPNWFMHGAPGWRGWAEEVFRGSDFIHLNAYNRQWARTMEDAVAQDTAEMVACIEAFADPHVRGGKPLVVKVSGWHYNNPYAPIPMKLWAPYIEAITAPLTDGDIVVWFPKAYDVPHHRIIGPAYAEQITYLAERYPQPA